MKDPKKYLEKIKNDVDEKLYDLLLVHLMDLGSSVKLYDDNASEMISLLERALKDLQRITTPYNKLQNWRYMLLICNKILLFDKTRQDIKDTKKKIVEEYVHEESHEEGKIPLENQINEIRITYDASYLLYLIPNLISYKEYAKALYLITAAKLVEPDNESLEVSEKKVRAVLKKNELSGARNTNPYDKKLLIDSNVLINNICYDVGKYRINSIKTFDLESLSKNNTLMISPSVIEEVKGHIEFTLIQAKRFCDKKDYLDYSEVESTLWKRFNDLIEKYKIEVSVTDIEAIKEFYRKYLLELEEIYFEKTQTMKMSKKLRKLAQRPELLPEEGDMKLLAEAKELEASILSNDKDFVNFSSEIFEEFGVEVWG